MKMSLLKEIGKYGEQGPRSFQVGLIVTSDARRCDKIACLFIFWKWYFYLGAKFK